MIDVEKKAKEVVDLYEKTEMTMRSLQSAIASMIHLSITEDRKERERDGKHK